MRKVITYTDEEYRDAAIRVLRVALPSDDVAVDDNARVSRDDDDESAWVQCWVWIPGPPLGGRRK